MLYNKINTMILECTLTFDYFYMCKIQIILYIIIYTVHVQKCFIHKHDRHACMLDC